MPNEDRQRLEDLSAADRKLLGISDSGAYNFRTVCLKIRLDLLGHNRLIALRRHLNGLDGDTIIPVMPVPESRERERSALWGVLALPPGYPTIRFAIAPPPANSSPLTLPSSSSTAPGSLSSTVSWPPASTPSSPSTTTAPSPSIGAPASPSTSAPPSPLFTAPPSPAEAAPTERADELKEEFDQDRGYPRNGTRRRLAQQAGHADPWSDVEEDTTE